MRIGNCDLCHEEHRYISEGKDSFGVHVLNLCSYGCADERSIPQNTVELDLIATCANCGRILKPEMKLIYIEYFSNVFCGSSCAEEYRHEMIRSETVVCNELNEAELSKYALKVNNGRLLVIQI